MTMRIERRPTVGERLRGLAAVLGILVLLVAAPLVLYAAWPLVVPSWLDWQTLQIVVLGGDVARVLVMAAYLAGWIVWLRLSWKVIREIVHQVRHAQRPHVPELPRGAVGRMVAAALTFGSVSVSQAVAAPAAAPTIVVTAPAVLRETQTEPVPRTGARAEPDTKQGNNASPSAERPAHSRTASVSYTVKPNDTLTKIAQRQLGDPSRFREIFEMNRAVIGPEPDFLEPGAVLRIPSDAKNTDRSTSRPDGEPKGGEGAYVVEPGDTLSHVALAAYDDPDRYLDIAEASKDTIQPDGERLTDPDLIRPGWHLTIPAPTKATPTADSARFTPSAEEPDPGSPAQDTGFPPPSDDEPTDADGPEPGPTGAAASAAEPRPSAVPAPSGNQPPPADTSADVSDDAETVAQDDATADDAELPPWALPGLLGGGAVVAAGLHLAIIRNRARQARYRRPGRVVAPIPADLTSVKETAQYAGDRLVPNIKRLDLLLRDLAGTGLESGARRPALNAVELTGSEAILHLAEAEDLPSPWSGGGNRWSAPLDASPDNSKELVPYPILATIGQDDAGHIWLLDLERQGVLGVTGDAEAVTAFGRYLAAELAFSPWTVTHTTHTVGCILGAAGMSRSRIEEHEDDTRFLDPIGAEIRSTYGDPAYEDREWFHTVITDATHSGQVADLAAAIREHPGRRGAAVVVLGGHAESTDPVLELAERRVRIPHLGLDLHAVGLTSEELTMSARILQVVRDTRDVASPDLSAGGGLRAWTEAADDVSTQAPDSRPEDSTDPAGDRSLLPLPDDAYLTSTANTKEDLARLAPVVPVSGAPDDPDPTLDADLEAWDDPQCPRPRLKLLGPVAVTATGDRQAAADRKPLLTAIFAFIALHPDGVTSEEIGATANVARSDARSKTAVLRSWIGDDPQSGEPYIPRGQRSQRRNGAPPFRYVVREALIDADLFLRLHARAARRGAEGIDDLLTALDLVSGEPLHGTNKDEHWQWARNVEQLDTRLSAAVSDVAHLVITYALVEKNTGLARRAHEIGHIADPDGEVLRADLVLIEMIEGHPEKADGVVRGIRAHVDDEGWPSEPTPRTRELLERFLRREKPAQQEGADRVSRA